MPGDKPKRILWFTQANSFSEQGGSYKVRLPSWVEALAHAISTENKVELAIAFQCEQSQVKRFTVGSSVFYPISFNLSSPFAKWRFKISHQVGKTINTDRYKEIIDDFKPDLIQIFGSEFQYAEVVSYTTVPVLLHIQSIVNPYLVRWYAGGIGGLSVLRFSRLSSLVKGSGVYHAYRRFRKQAEREMKVYKQCKYYAGRTDWDRTIVSFLAPTARYFHCDELLRTEFFKFSHRVREIKKLKIVTVINPNLYKGLETILETARLLKQHSALSFEWKVIGFSAGDDLVRITEKSKGIYSSRVDVNYSVVDSIEKLAAEVINGDLYVHTSHIENSSNAVCEAMLLGMPILCSDTGGAQSLITNQVEGILFPAGDAFYLAGKIVNLASDPEKRMSLGAAARAKALARHDSKRVTEKLLDVYEQIIGG